MGRLPKNKEIEENDDKILTPEQQALNYLKANKENHYNFEEDSFIKIPSSSLILNGALGGGLCFGAHRFVGINSGGKTSCALDFMMNFLKEKNNRRGIYFRCEGRLSPELRIRTGVEFTLDPNLWSDGVCLIFDSNIYETVFGFIRDLIINNPNKVKYFFILDSLDNMVKKDDLAKPLEEASMVAGGALITSVFLKKTALALAKRSHIAIFVSQIRDEIKINQYQQTTQRQGKSSGGHAIEHNASTVVDFLARYNDDLIRENPGDRNSKIIGHKCKIRLIKTDNEKNLTEISYPICYGRKGGKSVWREYEIIDLLLMWSMLGRKGDKGAWFNFEEKILIELKQIDNEFPEKVQGLDNLRQVLEEKPIITDYLYTKFSNLLTN